MSGDSGATWTPLGGELGSVSFIQGLAADATSSLIVAGNDRRMYRSQDLGTSWALANSGLQSTWIRALALDPSDPSNLWAGAGSYFAGGPGLFHSVDAGLSWSPAGQGGPTTVDTVAIDPGNSSRILGGKPGGGLPFAGRWRDVELVEARPVRLVRGGDRPGIDRAGLWRYS